MLDALLGRIRAAAPDLPALTEAETFLLKAYLDRYPAPQPYYEPDYDAQRRIGTVGEYTDPDEEAWWIHLRATLEYNRQQLRDAGKGQATTDEPDTESGKPPEPNARSDVTLDERALAVFIAHTDWTKKEIARHLGCHAKSLAPNRCPKLAAAIAAHKSPIDPGQRRLRGTKDADGNLEAWEDG